MASGDYYDVSAILAEETYVPARLVHGCTGGSLGKPDVCLVAAAHRVRRAALAGERCVPGRPMCTAAQVG